MSKPRILLVDDEPDLVDTVKFRLEQEGYEVATAADGLEALDQARRLEPDLIILDVMMPKENSRRPGVGKNVKENADYLADGKKSRSRSYFSALAFDLPRIGAACPRPARLPQDFSSPGTSLS